jgi:integrase
VITSLLDNAPVGSVSKPGIRRLGLDIIELPANMTKLYPGLSAKEVLALLGDDRSVERLAPRSVNKYYQHVRSLFGWAHEHDHIAHNPCTVLRDVEEGRPQDARGAFDDDDIRALFAFLTAAHRQDYELWVPRIMALTGCRMGEAAQLRGMDVREVNGIWVFDFNEDDEGKNLKTENSRRLVPIHPRLIELGLLEWVKGKGGGYLLPEPQRKTDRPERSNIDRLSKRLGTLLRQSGIEDSRKVMQSFRSTVATRLKNEEVQEYVIAEILGHENDNISTGRYGKMSDLSTRHKAISRLALPI